MPKIQESMIHALHPTQLTVGMIEVADKRKHLAALRPPDQRSFMQAHPIPAVIGPAGQLYITDHHHLGRAALEAGVASGFFMVEADFSSYGLAEFWREMDKSLWVHPLDESGVRHLYAAIPHHLEALVDDIYRSLSGYVRDAGGFDKTPTAFAEFVWADFFRRSVAIEDVKADFQAAVKTALPLARSPLAKGLPGFTGS
ncbi:MAG: ParB-like protein [Thiobacillaceae bacterium]